MTHPMTPEQFTAALAAIGWKQSDFYRRAGLAKQTPSRWATGQAPIPGWVPMYLGAMLDIQRLHATYVLPLRPGGADAGPETQAGPADDSAE